MQVKQGNRFLFIYFFFYVLLPLVGFRLKPVSYILDQQLVKPGTHQANDRPSGNVGPFFSVGRHSFFVLSVRERTLVVQLSE